MKHNVLFAAFTSFVCALSLMITSCKPEFFNFRSSSSPKTISTTPVAVTPFGTVPFADMSAAEAFAYCSGLEKEDLNEEDENLNIDFARNFCMDFAMLNFIAGLSETEDAVEIN